MRDHGQMWDHGQTWPGVGWMQKKWCQWTLVASLSAFCSKTPRDRQTEVPLERPGDPAQLDRWHHSGWHFSCCRGAVSLWGEKAPSLGSAMVAPVHNGTGPVRNSCTAFIYKIMLVHCHFYKVTGSENVRKRVEKDPWESHQRLLSFQSLCTEYMKI